MENFKDSKEQAIQNLVRRAGSNLKMSREDRSIKGLEALLRESKYSKRLLSSMVRSLMQAKMYTRAREYSEDLLNYHKNDADAKRLCAHAAVLTHKYQKGIELFKSIDLGSEVRDLERVLAKYLETKREPGRFEKLGRLLDEISAAEGKSSSYDPSVYTYVKYNHVLYDYIKVGIESRKAGLSRKAEDLYQNVKTDETGYFYVAALIFDDDERAERVYKEARIARADLRAALNREFQSQQKRRKKSAGNGGGGSARQRSYGSGSAGSRSAKDHRGYYQCLKISTDATDKQIKRAFLKETKKNDYLSYKGKDEKEYRRREKIQKDINKAYDTLKSPETRKKYDMGLDEEQAQGGGGGHHDAHAFENFFEAFFGRGGGFSGFNRRGGDWQRQNGQRTTYYYYYA